MGHYVSNNLKITSTFSATPTINQFSQFSPFYFRIRNVYFVFHIDQKHFENAVSKKICITSKEKPPLGCHILQGHSETNLDQWDIAHDADMNWWNLWLTVAAKFSFISVDANKNWFLWCLSSIRLYLLPFANAELFDWDLWFDERASRCDQLSQDVYKAVWRTPLITRRNNIGGLLQIWLASLRTLWEFSRKGCFYSSWVLW